MTRDDLLAERDRLLTLFDEAPVYLTVLEGPELRVTRINRRVREIMPSLLGMRGREVYPADNPILATVERVYATGVAETISEMPPYFADGSYANRYFTRTYVPLRDEHGNVDGVLTLGYEVTDEVHARRAHQEAARISHTELQRLLAILEEAPVFINVLEGPEMRVVMMNRAARQLFAGRDLMGVSIHDMLPPTSMTRMAIGRVYASGVPETFEVVASTVEGFEGRWFTTTVVPIRDTDLQLTRVMTVSFEMTEQRRAREAAVEASRAKDDFLAMLGHELRNPLAPMVTTLELMRLRGTTSPELELLERQVRHLIRLVDDLLDVSRITRGMVELERRDLEISTVIHRALEMTGPVLEQRRHRILSDLTPASVHGDPDRLAQVLANLITNAAKYSDVGSQIRILTERAGDRVKLSVADEGVGIAPDMLGKVFDAFVQQPQTLARSRGGLGLGLAIVKSFVEAHGGTVTVHSDGVGHGSTFVIELPAIERTAVRSEPAPRPDRARLPRSPLRILLVEDNCDVAASLAQGLEFFGHIVAVAYDGPSALTLAASFRPQVGLLDIGLPVMDGFELAVALRAAHPIRLIAITGYGAEHDRQRSREAGFEVHLVKPVDLEHLVQLLQQLELAQ
jgi:signal transduction histidine kinase